MNYYKKILIFKISKVNKVFKLFSYQNFKKRKNNEINYYKLDSKNDTIKSKAEMITNKEFNKEIVYKESILMTDNIDYEINKSLFNNKKELLILEVDFQQRIFIFGVYFIILLATIYCFYYTFKRKEKRRVYKAIMFVLGLLLFSTILNLPRSLKNFITKIHLLDCGKKLRISYYFNKSEVIFLKDFKKLQPNNNIISINEYKKLLIEGYPIVINGKLKVVSRNSKFYYKELYKEIEKGSTFKII